MELIKRFDERAGSWILGWPAGWQPVFAAVSFFGLPWVVLVGGLSGFVSAAASGQSQIERAFFLAGIAYAINTAIKLLLRRRRPHNLKISTLGLNSYSFPSGHAFGATIFYGLYAYLDYRFLPRPADLIIVAAIFFLVLLVGISRIRLAAHYPSDVVGGWLLGLVSLWLVIRLSF